MTLQSIDYVQVTALSLTQDFIYCLQ